MIVNYVEINEPINTKYQTWIIAYCPDIDEFFITNERHFFWEFEKEFYSEEDAIKYFESNILYFLDIKNKILSAMFCNHPLDSRVWLADTKKIYTVDDKNNISSEYIENR